MKLGAFQNIINFYIDIHLPAIHQRCLNTATVLMIRRSLVILLFVLFLPWPALAVLTLGAAPQKDALIQTERQAVQFASALQRRLGEEVKVRIFPDEETLHTWLNRYQQVDIASFTKDYLRGQPAGEFFQLRGTAPFGSLAPLVLRQGVSQRLLQRIQKAVTALAAEPSARAIFQKPAVVPRIQPAPAAPKPLPKPARAAAAAPPKARAVPPVSATAPAAPPSEAPLVSPPLPEEKTPAPSPPQAPNETETSRIRLEGNRITPTTENEEPSVSSEIPATEQPAAIRPTTGAEPHNQYSRDTDKPKEASPVASKTAASQQSWWGTGFVVALIVLVVGLLLLRRRRRSVIHGITLAPHLPTHSQGTGAATTPNPYPAAEPETSDPAMVDAPETAEAASARGNDDFMFSDPVAAVARSAEEETRTGNRGLLDPVVTEDETTSDENEWNREDPYLEESGANGEVVPEPFPELESSERENPEGFVDEPESLGQGDGETAEGSPDIEPDGLEDFRTDNEFEPMGVEPSELPLTEQLRANQTPEGHTEAWNESTPTDEAENISPPFTLDTTETDNDEGSVASLEDPYLSSETDDMELPGWSDKSQAFPVDPEDVRNAEIFSEAASTTTGISAAEDSSASADDLDLQELSPLPNDKGGLKPFAFDGEPPMPLAETPDYRNFFQAERAEEATVSARPVPLAPPVRIDRRRPSALPIRYGSGHTPSLQMRGELGPSQVPALLKLISGQKQGGTLTVHSRRNEKRIYFRKGKIAAALNYPDQQIEPGDPGNKIGDLLVQQGVISEQDREHALEIWANQPFRKIEEVLMETCQLTYEDLKAGLRTQVEELIFSLILFPRGSFEYVTEPNPVPAEQDLAIDINDLLKEAADQAGEWRELRKVIPSLDTVLEFKENSRKKLNNARMTGHQELILRLVDGQRSIQDICHQTGMLELEVYTFLCLMTKARFISPVRKKSLPAG